MVLFYAELWAIDATIIRKAHWPSAIIWVRKLLLAFKTLNKLSVYREVKKLTNNEICLSSDVILRPVNDVWRWWLARCTRRWDLVVRVSVAQQNGAQSRWYPVEWMTANRPKYTGVNQSAPNNLQLYFWTNSRSNLYTAAGNKLLTDTFRHSVRTTLHIDDSFTDFEGANTAAHRFMTPS